MEVGRGAHFHVFRDNFVLLQCRNALCLVIL